MLLTVKMEPLKTVERGRNLWKSTNWTQSYRFTWNPDVSTLYDPVGYVPKDTGMCALCNNNND